jgi:hypothetical protein
MVTVKQAEVFITNLEPKREVLHSTTMDVFSPLASHDQMELHLISLLVVVFVGFKPPEQAYFVMDWL